MDNAVTKCVDHDVSGVDKESKSFDTENAAAKGDIIIERIVLNDCSYGSQVESDIEALKNGDKLQLYMEFKII